MATVAGLQRRLKEGPLAPMPPWQNTERVGRSTDTQHDALSNINSAEYDRGPVEEYDARVKSGQLRNDDHQRSMCAASP